MDEPRHRTAPRKPRGLYQLEMMDPKIRRCLGLDCGRLFRSSWAGNRMCPKCTEKMQTFFEKVYHAETE